LSISHGNSPFRSETRPFPKKWNPDIQHTWSVACFSGGPREKPWFCQLLSNLPWANFWLGLNSLIYKMGTILATSQGHGWKLNNIMCSRHEGKLPWYPCQEVVSRQHPDCKPHAQLSKDSLTWRPREVEALVRWEQVVIQHREAGLSGVGLAWLYWTNITAHFLFPITCLPIFPSPFNSL
jgi:hypothetical protein